MSSRLLARTFVVHEEQSAQRASTAQGTLCALVQKRTRVLN